MPFALEPICEQLRSVYHVRTLVSSGPLIVYMRDLKKLFRFEVMHNGRFTTIADTLRRRGINIYPEVLPDSSDAIVVLTSRGTPWDRNWQTHAKNTKSRARKYNEK
jgi:hypothetical protein